jgi:DNA ligase-1
MAISPQILTDKAEVIRSFHEEQIKKGLEGVVVKKWDSPYEPGRRGFAWVKFKEEEGKTGKLTDTIDAVVLGYYVGEGKRSGFGIGAFLVGVRKHDEFVTLTKIGTGVSDDLWKELKSELEGIKVQKQPKQYSGVHKAFVPDVWVNPTLVVEIAGDDLTKSPTHGAGFAVRFPRLVHIRRDKGPDQATTVLEIAKMFEAQMSHHTKK